MSTVKAQATRDKLKQLGSEERHRFQGVVQRFGWKSGFKRVLRQCSWGL